MGRKIKACIPCHERKVRCDSANVGTPCSRCNEKNRTHSCVMLQASDREERTLKRKWGHESVDKATDQVSLLPLSPIPTASPPNEVSQHNISHSTPKPFSSVPYSPGYTRSHPRGHSNLLSRPSENSSPESLGLGSKDDTQPALTSRVYRFVQEQPIFISSESPDDCHEVIDYHDGTNSITILSETLGPAVPNTRIQKTTHLASPWSEPPSDTHGLGDVDTEYLHQKGAFIMPSPRVCDKFLHLFFERVYLAVPVVDRVTLVQEYRQGTLSKFLLQSILASVIPHAPMDLLNEAGFQDRSTAQETLFARAKLLHDFDIEKSQLRILQGSLILSITHVSHYMPRDYRYWLSNAVCIATKMGLHRNIVRQEPDPSTKRLHRRIWWTLYTWDAILALNGMDTRFRFHENDFDTPHLTPDDWEEELPPGLQGVLPPTTKVERYYLIESARLSLIIGRFWHKFPMTNPETSFQELETAISEWREILPPHLKSLDSQDTTMVSSWNLTLMARSYICECIMYRMIRRSPCSGEALIRRANERLYTAMFELDCIIERVMNRNSGHFNTWLLPTFIATTVALQVEKVLNPSTRNLDGVLAKLRIHGKLEFLREMSKEWPYINGLVRMLEGVLRSTSLAVPLQEVSPGPGLGAEYNQGPDNPSESTVELATNKPATGVGNNSWFLNFAEAENARLFDLAMGSFNPASLLDELFSDNTQDRNGLDLL